MAGAVIFPPFSHAGDLGIKLEGSDLRIDIMPGVAAEPLGNQTVLSYGKLQTHFHPAATMVGIFQAVAANEYWPQKMADAVTAMHLSPMMFLFGFMGLILILGCFLDGMAMILLTVPVVFPIAKALGIDPLHLGILMTINIELGVITPPVGFNLYAVSGIGRIPVNEVLKGSIPLFLVILAFLVFMIFFPEVATWLPNIVFKPIQFGG